MTAKSALRPLCLSFWTPPAPRPQAFLIGKMLPEWLTQGVNPILVTYEKAEHWNIPVPTHHVPQPPHYPVLGKIPFAGGFLEDRYYERLYRLVEKVVRTEKPDLLFSFANPQNSNVIGAMVKQRLGLPFIAHFSDPWYNNRYASPWSVAAKRTKKLEKFVVEQADAIVFIADELRTTILQKYGPNIQAKGVTIPHCFDPAAYPITNNPNNTPFIISHLGIFRHDRTPEPLFAAVRLLLDAPQAPTRAIKIRLFGSTNSYTSFTAESLVALTHKYHLTDVVEIIPTVDFAESLRQMKLADCLVVIDANVPNCNFVLSKIVDYAGSGTPSVGIMPHDNPTAVWLKNAGQASFAYNEMPALATYLHDLMTGTLSPRYNEAFVKQFSVTAVTQKLIDTFNTVIAH